MNAHNTHLLDLRQRAEVGGCQAADSHSAIAQEQRVEVGKVDRLISRRRGRRGPAMRASRIEYAGQNEGNEGERQQMYAEEVEVADLGPDGFEPSTRWGAGIIAICLPVGAVAVLNVGGGGHWVRGGKCACRSLSPLQPLLLYAVSWTVGHSVYSPSSVSDPRLADRLFVLA